jgi:Flp pilus assembly protein TadG
MTRTFRPGRIRFARDASGAASVEFAIISTVFIVLMFGMSYAAIMLFDRASLQWAVERASRLAVIDVNASQAEIASSINDYLAGAGLPSADVEYSVSNSSGYPIANIQASFQRTYTVPLVATFNVNFSASTYVPRGS